MDFEKMELHHQETLAKMDDHHQETSGQLTEIKGSVETLTHSVETGFLQTHNLLSNIASILNKILEK